MAKFLGVEGLLRQTTWEHLWQHSRKKKKSQIKPVVTTIIGNKVKEWVPLVSTQT